MLGIHRQHPHPHQIPHSSQAVGIGSTTPAGPRAHALLRLLRLLRLLPTPRCRRLAQLADVHQAFCAGVHIHKRPKVHLWRQGRAAGRTLEGKAEHKQGGLLPASRRLGAWQAECGSCWPFRVATEGLLLRVSAAGTLWQRNCYMAGPSWAGLGWLGWAHHVPHHPRKLHARRQVGNAQRLLELQEGGSAGGRWSLMVGGRLIEGQCVGPEMAPSAGPNYHLQRRRAPPRCSAKRAPRRSAHQHSSGFTLKKL